MDEKLKEIALKYFDEHPEAKERVKRTVTYQRLIRESHHYEWNSKLQNSVCWVCGQSWYQFPATVCPGFKKNDELSMPEHIKQVLRDEEALYQQTIARCEVIVKQKCKTIEDVTGDVMVELHTTHGCDPETLEAILECTIPKDKYNAYLAGMERERELSRSRQVKEIITIVK